MSSISDKRNYYSDLFYDKSNIPTTSDSVTGGTNSSSSKDITDGESSGDSDSDESKLTNWTIALLVVVIATSTCSITTVVIFIVRKRMILNRNQE